MTFKPDNVNIFTFDSYSTLVDVESVKESLSSYVDNPDPVSDLWRTRSLEYTMVSNFTESYQTFYEMNRDALKHALNTYGIELSEEEIENILSTYHKLEVFSDVKKGMKELKELGYDLYVLSNGNPEMLESMIDHAGIESLIDGTISAHEIETYKPSPNLYEYAADRIGVPTSEIAHVAALWFDVQGAKSAGMQGVWIDRKDEPWDPFDGEPDLKIKNLHELVDEL